MIADTNNPWIMSNIFYEDTNELIAGAKEYQIYENNDLKVSEILKNYYTT